jgi:hypothetical protein
MSMHVEAFCFMTPYSLLGGYRQHEFTAPVIGVIQSWIWGKRVPLKRLHPLRGVKTQKTAWKPNTVTSEVRVCVHAYAVGSTYELCGMLTQLCNDVWAAAEWSTLHADMLSVSSKCLSVTNLLIQNSQPSALSILKLRNVCCSTFTRPTKIRGLTSGFYITTTIALQIKTF